MMMTDVVVSIRKAVFTSHTLRATRELLVTFAAVAIVLSPILASVKVIEPWAAALLVIAGIVFAFLHDPLERRERRCAAEEESESRERLYRSAMRGDYVLTPHRLAILRQRGVGNDVVRDLGRKLLQPVPERKAGYEFFGEIKDVLGSARYDDAIATMVEVFDASRVPAVMAVSSKDADDA